LLAIDEQSGFSTYDNSEFVTVQELELEDHNEIPSDVSKWGEYLQKERELISAARSDITAKKKSMRQKQRRLEISKNQWKKDRDKLKLMSIGANYGDGKQLNSVKHALKKKKYDLDEHVHEINEQILEIREASQLLSKRESRLQTLEIEYLRSQNIHTPHYNPNNNHNIAANDAMANRALLKTATQESLPCIPLMPHPPSYPIPMRSSLDAQQMNLYDVQSLQQKIADAEQQQTQTQQRRFVIRSNSVGHHALDSVLSKYAKHNQHTQRTIDHHKSWLKSFQSELQGVSHSINHNKQKRSRDTRHERRIERHETHSPVRRKHQSSEQGAGEVVIRLKIEK